MPETLRREKQVQKPLPVEVRPAAFSAATWIGRLQRLASALSQALSSQEVADAIISHGMAALNASGGVVAELNAGRAEFEIVQAVGCSPELVKQFRTFSADAKLPIADAVRRNDLIVLESIEQRNAYYPELTRLPVTASEAWLAIPMGSRNRAVGALGLSFSEPRKFNEQERLFIRTLAVLCGHALDRAHLCDSERIARERAQRAEQDLKRLVRERTRHLQMTLGKLHDLTSGLLTAQDNERKWVSGELHDDFNQKLAAVELELARLELHFSEVAPNIGSLFDPVKSLVRQISDDIRRVAYKIHPASLDHLSLPVVLKSYCADFGRRQGIDIKFSHRTIPDSLPPDVMLCMYRVTQECLSNVARHSSAKNASVSITCKHRDLHLSIQDSGAGFNLKKLQDSRGLGVLYMKERVRGVKGTFSIGSKQGKGVRIDVHITLSPRARSATR